MQVKGKVKKGLKVSKEWPAEHAYKLAKRAYDTLAPISNPFSFYAYFWFGDWGTMLHDARMDLEQASQVCAEFHKGCPCLKFFACAADDLMPYDPFPNIHPMNERISSGCCPEPLLTAVFEPRTLCITKHHPPRRAKHNAIDFF